MRIIYTSKKFADMPKRDKINIIKSGILVGITACTFWEKLDQFRNIYKQKRA